MIWSVAEQVSLLSEHVTLKPGGVLLTETPGGIGLATGTYLQVGDKIEAEIEGLGKLEVESSQTHHRPANGSDLTLGARAWLQR